MIKSITRDRGRENITEHMMQSSTTILILSLMSIFFVFLLFLKIFIDGCVDNSPGPAKTAEVIEMRLRWKTRMDAKTTYKTGM